MEENMRNQYGVDYNVDFVFCIDATASMRPVIDMVKAGAINFYSDVTNAMGRKGKSINQMRIRIVAYRDYVADGDGAMMVTDFFNFPEDAAMFNEAVNSIEAVGGGDEPEHGLEALAYAIKSNWSNPIQGQKRRQVIVVWTDASTHELGHGAVNPNYPANMARNFGELSEWWGDVYAQNFMDDSGKRLLLFAPNVKHWSTISDNWNNVLHFPSRAGEGLGEFIYHEILDTIANSV
jgi:hypothetical protein